MLSEALLFVLALSRVIAEDSKRERVPLIILGVDGYGYDAYTRYGNKSSGDTNIFPIQTVFPSKTFPNFMAIATGLHPTQHGIISNKFYNAKRDKVFSYEDSQNKTLGIDWYKGEPIWITARKAGLRSYVDMWVGSFAEYNGMQPNIVFKYNGSKTFQKKIDGVIANMDSEDDSVRCDLYMLYTNQPDKTLHNTDYSDGRRVESLIDKAEKNIALFKSSLGDRKYNLIITSDHGMAGYKRKYELSRALKDKAKIFYGGVTSMWYSKHETNTSVAEEAAELNEYLASSDMSGVVAKEVATMDSRFQLCGLEDEGRPDIIFMMKDDVAVQVYSQMSGHGFDNTFPTMYAHVRVSGPGFKKVAGVENKPIIMNTELYNLFCSLLGIKPASNTGRLDTFDFLLSDSVRPNRTEWQGSYSQLPLPCSAAQSRSVLAILGLLLHFIVVRL